MDAAEAKNRFCFKVKIYLNDFEDNKTDEYLEMREPNMKEISLLTEDEDNNKKVLMDLLPACIVNSSFTKADGTSLKGKEAFEIINSSASVTTQVLNDWLNACPFTLRNQTKEN